MDTETKSLIINLTEGQAKLLKAVFEKGVIASGASGLSGHGLGRISSSLHQAGFIEPMGRLGRQTKWQAVPLWEGKLKDYRKDILDLLEKISGSS